MQKLDEEKLKKQPTQIEEKAPENVRDEEDDVDETIHIDDQGNAAKTTYEQQVSKVEINN